MINESESFAFGVQLMKAALKTLSLTPQEQAVYLEKGGYGDCSDELALEFDDAYQVVKGYFGQQCFPAEVEIILGTIDVQLKSISGPDKAKFWITSALQRSEWNSIRDLASRALKSLRA